MSKHREKIDTFTEEGAKEIAERIRAYWKARGFTVKTHIEIERDARKERNLWSVRSDMLNGLPR